jgi:hypothetical protein|tara:strand:- start:1773 stop:2087 length:315 start_codon:yes stop_codon:yes gene_type:complete
MGKYLIYKETNMKTLVSFFGIASLMFVTSCASVGGAWNAGTEIITGTVDSVVGGAATMAVAITDDARNIADVTIDTAQGVVKTVAENVDKQTDELQKDNAPEGK